MTEGATELTAAREAFCALVRAEWVAADASEPAVKEANRQVEATNKLVRSWQKEGEARVQEILLPLLEDESPHVRYAAAAHLLYHGASEQARDVLEALADDDEAGSVGTLAEGALLGWEKRRR